MLLTVFLFIVSLSQIVSGWRGLIVVPGLGRADRLTTVIDNLKLLEKDYINGKRYRWDCVVYVYAPRSESSFWSLTKEIDYVRSLCRIVENPKGKVTENLYMLQPALIRNSYSRIFILLDDQKLVSNSKTSDGLEAFDMLGMMRVMRQNNLTVLSPLISGANKGGGQQFRNIMQTPAQPGTIGYISSFVEIFVWMMTFPAYEALWELLCPSVNPYGWGYDLWYDGYARERVPGHKMGILSTVKVLHVQDSTAEGGGRTDTNSVETKWQAVVAQERHYKQYLNIDLKKYSKTCIANSSWNGAVKGYIRARPIAFGS